MKKFLKASLVLSVVLFCGCMFGAVVTQSIDNGSGEDPGTLSWAINQGGTVTFNLEDSKNTILLVNVILVSKPVIIDGGSGITIQNGINNRTFQISTTSGTTTFKNLIIEGTNTIGDFSAGILLQSGNLVLDNVTVEGGKAAYGGGIYVGGSGNSATLTLQNGTTITDNTATICGGGIYIDNGGVVTISASGANSYVDKNTADQSGGGIYVNNGGTLNGILLHSDSNQADCNGGGICVNTTGQATLSNATISNNTAQNGGGVFSISATGVTIDQTTHIVSNTATIEGGGICVGGGGKLTLNNAIVGQNDSSVSGDATGPNEALNGGGICVDGGIVTIQNNSQVCKNIATELGGGLFIVDGGTVNTAGAPTISYLLAGNQAGWGGGVYVGSNSTFNASYSNISDNNCTGSYSDSSQRGAGICSITGTVILNEVNVDGNVCCSSASYGAGIYNEGGTLNITRSTISYNSCPYAITTRGGGIYNGNNYGTEGKCDMVFSTIYGNAAGLGGGVCDYGYVLDHIRSCSVVRNIAQFAQKEDSASGVYVFGNKASTTIVCSLLANVGSENNLDLYAVNGGTIYIYFSTFETHNTGDDSSNIISTLKAIDDGNTALNNIVPGLDAQPLPLVTNNGNFTQTVNYQPPSKYSYDYGFVPAVKSLSNDSEGKDVVYYYAFQGKICPSFFILYTDSNVPTCVDSNYYQFTILDQSYVSKNGTFVGASSI